MLYPNFLPLCYEVLNVNDECCVLLALVAARLFTSFKNLFVLSQHFAALADVPPLTTTRYAAGIFSF